MTNAAQWLVGLLVLAGLEACGAGIEPGAGGATEPQVVASASDDGGAGPAASAAGEDEAVNPLGITDLLSCGNGLCDGTFEDCLTCPLDCGICNPELPGGGGLTGETNCNRGFNACGNGVCQVHACEDAHNCPQDCAPSCGDGACTHTETCETCADDCGACRTCENGGLRCGDGICNCVEDWTNCGDCTVGFCNHNAVCDVLLGETASNCPDCSLE